MIAAIFEDFWWTEPYERGRLIVASRRFKDGREKVVRHLIDDMMIKHAVPVTVDIRQMADKLNRP